MNQWPLKRIPDAVASEWSQEVARRRRVPAVIYAGRPNRKTSKSAPRKSANLIHHAVSEICWWICPVENDARAKRLALVQEIQHHPLEGDVLHVDFHEVTETKKWSSWCRWNRRRAAGVKNSGGVLEHVVFKLKVRALPRDLPEQMVVDVSQLELGKSIHLGEIKAPAGVEILGDKDIASSPSPCRARKRKKWLRFAEGEAVAAATSK